MKTPNRPLSPHLQIYRWQISNTLSIVHRIAGVLLSFGLIVFALWLVALASGNQAYETCMHCMRGPIGLLIGAGALLAFFFHLLNGVRHLFWDAGWGFERTARHASGIGALIGAIVLSAVVMIWIKHSFG